MLRIEDILEKAESYCSEAGLDLLDRLDGPVDELHHRQLCHMSESSLATLRDLLGTTRGAP